MSGRAAFDWYGPFLLEQQPTDEERMVRDSAHACCQERQLPRVLEAFRWMSYPAAAFCG